MITESIQATNFDELIEAYEAARLRDVHAQLEDHLPAEDHPGYLSVLREMVRVDLEFGWERGRPAELEEYLRRFPSLAENRDTLQEVAFEEYRQRCQAGQNPCPEEYLKCYGVDIDDWLELESNGDKEGPKTVILDAGSAKSHFSDNVKSLRPSQESRLSNSGEEAVDPAKEAIDMPQVGSDFLGFRLIEELGSGAFGHVFLALQQELANRPVALKISSHPVSESQLLAQLQHTNIVPIYSFHDSPPLQAICMPYFGCTTLADIFKELQTGAYLPASGKHLVSTLHQRKTATRLASKPSFSMTPTDERPRSANRTLDDRAIASQCCPTEFLEQLERLRYVEAVLWLAVRIADGLNHAHERGIVHRDLKPANVLLSDEGQPMLLDFNLSDDVKQNRSASAARIGGTLPYMSPEQLKSFEDRNLRVDRRSDIFSLGVILFELLTGRHAFEVHKGRLDSVLPLMIVDRQKSKPRLRCWNRSITPAVEAIVRHCLESDPEKRYQTADELREDLERQLANLPLKYASEPSLRERSRKWMRRHPRLASSTSMSVVAAALVGILSIGLFWQSDRLTRHDSRTTFAAFEDDMDNLRFRLTRTVGGDSPKTYLARGRQLLRRYEVLSNPTWKSTSAVQYLSTRDQRRLHTQVADLLVLMAQNTIQQNDSEKESIHNALRLNELAETCFAKDRAPRAIWEQRSELFARIDRKSDAERFRTLAERTPARTAQDHYLLASRNVAQRRYADAHPELLAAVRQDPEHFWARFYLGRCQYDVARYADAVACYSTCIALRPEFSKSYYNRGLASYRQRDYPQANADFDRALQLEPNWTDAYISRALTRFALKKYPEALDDLNHAIKQLDAPTRVYFMRARVRDKLGDKKGAEQDREKGLRLQPRDIPSWIARGIARMKDDPKGALTDFQKASQLDPRSITALQNQAHVLSEKLNRAKEAIVALNRILEMNPDYVKALGGRAVLLARQGKYAAAFKDAEKCLAAQKHPSVPYQVAGVYALASKTDPDAAKEALRLLSVALVRGYGFQLIERDPDLIPLRQNVEFRRFVSAMRFIRSFQNKNNSN